MSPARSSVHQAAPRHAADLARMLRAFNAEFDTWAPTDEDLTRRFAQMLARDDVLALLTGAPDRWLGFALLTLRPTPYYDGPLAQLEELYVDPGHRGRGLGSALLEHAVGELRARACGEWHINVDEVDVDARRFYERHGFTNVEPGTDDRMLCYVREL